MATLLVAGLLIYHYGMAWWWYGGAAMVWLAHIALMINLHKSN
jgi:hypothetical protein